MMAAPEIIAASAASLAILAGIWRLIRSIYHLVRLVETSLARLGGVEKELRPNGGASLRDRLDSVHDLAADNNEKHGRIERRLNEQAVLTADAARLAAKNDDEIAHIRAETRRRHQENLIRLDALERNDEDAKILRELLLMSLKDRHGIDLLPDDDDDPPPLHIA